LYYVDKIQANEKPSRGGGQGPVARTNGVNHDAEGEEQNKNGHLEAFGNDFHGNLVRSRWLMKEGTLKDARSGEKMQ